MQQRATASWWRPLVLFASLAAAIAVASDTVPSDLLDGVPPLLVWAVIVLVPALVLAIPAGDSELERWRRAQRADRRPVRATGSTQTHRLGNPNRPPPVRPTPPGRTAELQRLQGSLSAIERQRRHARQQTNVRPGVEHIESLLALEVARLRGHLQRIEQRARETAGEPEPADQR